MQPRSITAIVAGIGAGSLALAGALHAQQAPPLDRLRTMPGVEQYTKMAPLLNGSIISGAVTPTWAADGQSFSYALNGKLLRVDVASMKPVETGDAPVAAAGGRAGGRGAGGGVAPGRGRGAGNLPSGVAESLPAGAGRARPSERLRAVARRQDEGVLPRSQHLRQQRRRLRRNRADHRRQRGGAHQVRRRQLGLRRRARTRRRRSGGRPTARKVALLPLRRKPGEGLLPADGCRPVVQASLDVEAYPKAGTDNPIADVFVYDVAHEARRTTLDVRDGKPFTNDVVGHYVYDDPAGRRTAPSCSMNRTNRRQQIMEFVACNPATAKCRVVVREEWLTGWVDNRPQLRWLADSKRFIWESERNGWTNYYLYDLTGKLHQSDHARTRRSRPARSSRSTKRPACVLHGARRRQPHEDAAASRRPRRQGRRAADRSEVHAHASTICARTTSTSSTSIRRTISRRRRSVVDIERQGRRRAREERHVEVRRSSASRRSRCSPTRRPTARRRSTARSRFRRTSIRRRSTRRWCRSTAARRRAATCRPRTSRCRRDHRVRLPRRQI